MPKPHAASTAIVIAAILLVVVGLASSGRAESTTTGKPKPFVAAAQEPGILKKIIAAHWRLADARTALPPVQVVYKETLETQDWIEYAYDGGALRLYVSPGPKGGDIFGILVDTRNPRYAHFSQLPCTKRYTVYHHESYTAVVPWRPISRKLFEKLKSRRWTEQELRKQLGAPSWTFLFHGIGWWGLTYVPQGLSFVGQGEPVRYQLHDLDAEAEWRKQHEDDLEIPPVTTLSQLDYAVVQQEECPPSGSIFVSQREKIDQALANGKRSPDGRFVVGTVNFGGLDYSADLVVRETGKPERRYRADGFDPDYRWLNGRTIGVRIGSHNGGGEFHVIDATAGTMTLVTMVPEADHMLEFGVSGPDRFWYKTADGATHEVTVPTMKPHATSHAEK